jgi:hypothetical protein
MQRCAAAAVWHVSGCGMHICTSLQQQLYHCCMTIKRCKVQRCAAAAVCRSIYTCTSL